MVDTLETKSERVDVRMTPSVKRTLQQVAAARNKSLSEFLLDSSLNAAIDALADQRVFSLNDKQWKAFQSALAKPPKDNPRLRKLLARRPIWER